MEQFYHGSSILFNQFDLSHALEGDGKVKFGFGVYVTSHYRLFAGCTSDNSILDPTPLMTRADSIAAGLIADV